MLAVIYFKDNGTVFTYNNTIETYWMFGYLKVLLKV